MMFPNELVIRHSTQYTTEPIGIKTKTENISSNLYSLITTGIGKMKI